MHYNKNIFVVQKQYISEENKMNIHTVNLSNVMFHTLVPKTKDSVIVAHVNMLIIVIPLTRFVCAVGNMLTKGTASIDAIMMLYTDMPGI